MYRPPMVVFISRPRNALMQTSQAHMQDLLIDGCAVQAIVIARRAEPERTRNHGRQSSKIIVNRPLT